MAKVYSVKNGPGDWVEMCEECRDYMRSIHECQPLAARVLFPFLQTIVKHNGECSCCDYRMKMHELHYNVGTPK